MVQLLQRKPFTFPRRRIKVKEEKKVYKNQDNLIYASQRGVSRKKKAAQVHNRCCIPQRV